MLETIRGASHAVTWIDFNGQTKKRNGGRCESRVRVSKIQKISISSACIVYDRHGGSRVTHTCCDRLHRLLVKEIEEDGVETMLLDWEKVMVACFQKMDDEVSDCWRVVAVESTAALSVGSTEVVAMVREVEVGVANCGDSRVVMSRGGVVISMSDDLKIGI
ncbi:probable protein phosphatase 2C 8 [Camellia sinensis]|uniref:probable protein phosphatase 2C 8 n=1 Tax=Camellia sinensis TaxID=4442 RepID=UPI0010356D82|nr:probable protein phosphatase 2C 8 [Camellia sinensis]